MATTSHAPPTPATAAQAPKPSWRCPAGKTVLPAKAPHALWLARRREGLGASDAATVGGSSPWSDLTTLFAEKVHGFTTPDSDRMRVGRDLEPYVLSRFREATGLRTRRIGMLASREHPWMLASLDALSDDGGLVEAKTTTSNFAFEWEDPHGQESVPDHYLLQVQWQLKVSGRSHAWIACLFLDTREFIYRRVERDDALIELLVQMGADFWHHHVLPQVAPPLDPGAGSVMRALHPTVDVPTREGGTAAAVAMRRQARIKAQLKELADQLDTVNAELFAITGDAEVLTVDGTVAATWKHTGRFDDYAWAKATEPEIVRRYTRTCDYVDWRAVLADRPKDRRFRGRVFLPKAAFV
ncbi:phage-related protein [Alloactinosynnema sp. L-07]|uniref:YqaJ viral recombinase family nuclease n=1 Tax=Alloactinosynnema sp. L-07 TaxID=1653480 RepID=UPI00065EF8F7|nr:YqaJ viral recombinase family protein [Alloactinosynnema sp. L-07]CRK56954.1 phage-related protein [Alloactinosynnema sp. L-07]